MTDAIPKTTLIGARVAKPDAPDPAGIVLRILFRGGVELGFLCIEGAGPALEIEALVGGGGHPRQDNSAHRKSGQRHRKYP